MGDCRAWREVHAAREIASSYEAMTLPAGDPPMLPPRFVQPPIIMERDNDGCTRLRCDIETTAHYRHVPDLLFQRAQQIPDRAVIAQRSRDDRWQMISY